MKTADFFDSFFELNDTFYDICFNGASKEVTLRHVRGKPWECDRESTDRVLIDRVAKFCKDKDYIYNYRSSHLFIGFRIKKAKEIKLTNSSDIADSAYDEHMNENEDK